MPTVTAAQARRWALFGRSPNEWAIGGTEAFPKGHLIGRTEKTIVGTTGRQVGKTDELADQIDQAMNAEPDPKDMRADLPPHVGILGPTFSKTRISINRYIDNLTRVFGPDSYRMNQNEHWLIITDPLAGKIGARLDWMSADDPQNVVGETFTFVGIDESQLIPDEVYRKLTPTFGVRAARVLVFGTPDVSLDQTWFQGLWDQGQDPLDTNVHSFTIATWDAPWISSEEIQKAYHSGMPINDFLRLYGGQWVAEAGLVFTGYDLSMMPYVPAWEGKRKLVMAVDLAIQNDFNVAMIGDPMTRTAIHMERWNLTDPLETYDRILRIHEEWGKPKTWVDATGMGAIPARELKGHLGESIVAVEWSGADNAKYNKMNAVRALVGDLQHRKTMFPASWEDLRREMRGFVYQRTPSGKLTAAARGDAHDDIVMTLVMLNMAFAKGNGGGFDGPLNYLTGGGNSESRLRRLLGM